MHREHPITSYTELLTDETQVVDVREEDEVAEGMVPEALHIPLGDIPERQAELDPNKPLLLICRSGGRSGKAAEFLSEAGFTDVTNLTGGMLAHEGPTVIPGS